MAKRSGVQPVTPATLTQTKTLNNSTATKSLSRRSACLTALRRPSCSDMSYVAPDDVEIADAHHYAWANARITGLRPMFEIFDQDESWACAAHWSPEQGWG